MKGKLLFLVLLLSAIAYSQLLPSPLNSAVAFVVAGEIPGTNIVLGIWPMLGLSVLLILASLRFISHIRLKFLESKAKSITSERLASEFKESNSSGIETKNTAVIAARHFDQ